MHGAVEDRLAVFVLADLQIGRVGGRLDEVAGRVDHEEAEAVAGDLAAEEHGDVERTLALLLLLHHTVDAMDFTDGAADELGRLEHRVDAVERLGFAGLGVAEPLARHGEDRLADRQIAGAGNRQSFSGFSKR